MSKQLERAREQCREAEIVFLQNSEWQPALEHYRNAKATVNRLEVLERIIDTAIYGLKWLNDSEISASYKLGGIETLGHVLACQISQWVTNKGVSTSDTILALKLKKNPDREHLRRNLLKFL